MVSFVVLLRQRGYSAMGSEWGHVGSYSVHSHFAYEVSNKTRVIGGVEKTMGSRMGSDGARDAVS